MEQRTEQKNQIGDNKEKIQDRISFVEGQIKETDRLLEPLYDKWGKFMRDFNITKNSIKYFQTEEEVSEGKMKVVNMELERDNDPDFKKINILRVTKQEQQDELAKLRREHYENSLNELKSEASELSDKAYKQLDSLTKEHVDPLIKEYGMTEETAKSQLKYEVSNLIDNLEEKINIYEQIQSDIEQFLADKNQGHDIERLKNQLKAAERFK